MPKSPDDLDPRAFFAKYHEQREEALAQERDAAAVREHLEADGPVRSFDTVPVTIEGEDEAREARGRIKAITVRPKPGPEPN